ncbi:ATP-dependent dethiobiotin synthetase BioD [uncultured archaeon]|nr:ATP-dependent dethiobiotin synthetase BioD [uncultured archaeon]
MTGIFISGTDTDVGKTAVAAGLAGALRFRGYDIGVMKPVQSGAALRNGKLYSQDAELMKRAADSQDEDELICPVLLKEALAPGIAAEIEGKPIDIDHILKSCRELEKRHDFVVVEGAGGIAVPIKERFFISDLIKLFGLPAIVVARPGLGTINHTFLTIEYARKCGIHVIGVIINNYHGGMAEETNPGIISSLTGIPILGIIPHDPKICTECGELGDIVSLVQYHIDIEAIIGVKK